jgi:hypothetical protein
VRKGPHAFERRRARVSGSIHLSLYCTGRAEAETEHYSPNGSVNIGFLTAYLAKSNRQRPLLDLNNRCQLEIVGHPGKVYERSI